MTILKRLSLTTLSLCLNISCIISAYDSQKLQKEVQLISKFITDKELSTGQYNHNIANLKQLNSELSQLIQDKALAHENIVGFKETQEVSEFLKNRISLIEQNNKVITKNDNLRYWLTSIIESTYMTNNDEIIKIANIIETNNPSIEEELYAIRDIVDKRHNTISVIASICLFAVYAKLVFSAYVR